MAQQSWRRPGATAWTGAGKCDTISGRLGFDPHGRMTEGS